MSPAPEVYRVDGPVRRTWASLGAVIAALVVVVLICGVQPLVHALLSGSAQRLGVWMTRLALACVACGLLSLVLAVIGLVRDRGTPRVGAALIVAAFLAQLVFAVWGTASTVLEGNAVTVFDWVWAATSLLLVVLASVFVFWPPRPVSFRRG
ncbi:MAG: hypothetical protein WAX29_02030 [Propionibacterium sp.]